MKMLEIIERVLFSVLGWKVNIFVTFTSLQTVKRNFSSGLMKMPFNFNHTEKTNKQTNKGRICFCFKQTWNTKEVTGIFSSFAFQVCCYIQLFHKKIGLFIQDSFHHALFSTSITCLLTLLHLLSPWASEAADRSIEYLEICSFASCKPTLPSLT